MLKADWLVSLGSCHSLGSKNAMKARHLSMMLSPNMYRPTVDDAYLSVEPLELSRHSGQLFGSVHRWASNLMLLAILLHLSRVYLTGGLKKPRELTWVSGALLSFLALSFGVSGYSLPWDEIGFWALQVVSAVPETTDELSVPFEEVSQLVKRHSTEPLQHIH